jgi:hypothetical protein
MAEHRAEVPEEEGPFLAAPADQSRTVVVRSTQEAEPGRAVLRTIISQLPAMIGAVLLLPEVIQYILDGYGERLPDSFRTVLLGIAGFIVATTAIMTRVMASVSVNEWLRKNFKPAAPDNKPPLNGPVA